ncbi:MAG: hypothetical protein DHS80DRAFT_14113 [Piptocephalis tieghemiana]|nr:MAG: hypothetical protein DHS80DRAFT_14113 [Piptocephalis tieghemiana]
MSDIIRSCKPGSEWTDNELEAYNIRLVNKSDIDEFFQTQFDSLDLTELPRGILTCEGVRLDVDLATYKFMRFLDLAMRPEEGQESAVDDFAAELLRIMQYETVGRVVCMRKDIRLLMCGHRTHAKTDVCIIDTNDVLLLIQEDKSRFSTSNAIPQLVAEAIAAFQHNNFKRVYNDQLDPLNTFTFPCIIMVGSSPVFFKIPVSASLSKAVQHGTYPSEPTIIERFDPLFGLRRRSSGMEPIDNRTRVLKCFKAFKHFVVPFE